MNSIDNLKPCTPENARERQRKGAMVRKQNADAQRAIIAVIGTFLEDEFPIKEDGKIVRITGKDEIVRFMRKTFAEGGNNAVRLLDVMGKMAQGAPTILAQFNNYNGQLLTDSVERKAEFKRLMGDKLENIG